MKRQKKILQFLNLSKEVQGRSEVLSSHKTSQRGPGGRTEKKKKTTRRKRERRDPKHHRFQADNIFANALIWPLCTFLGDVPISSSSPLPGLVGGDTETDKSVVLVAASCRCDNGDFCCVHVDSLIVSKADPGAPSFDDFGIRRFRTGGAPNWTSCWFICIPRGSCESSQGVPVISFTLGGNSFGPYS